MTSPRKDRKEEGVTLSAEDTSIVGLDATTLARKEAVLEGLLKIEQMKAAQEQTPPVQSTGGEDDDAPNVVIVDEEHRFSVSWEAFDADGNLITSSAKLNAPVNEEVPQ